MKYEVIIDFESCHLEIEANSKEEAEEKAFKEFGNKEMADVFPGFWVGECWHWLEVVKWKHH